VAELLGDTLSIGSSALQSLAREGLQQTRGSSLRANLLRSALLICVWLGVAFAGAALFVQLESEHERQEAERYAAAGATSDATTKQSRPSLDRLNWDYSGCLFFCFTVMTTIGYGTFTPQTTGGRVVFIVFGLVGMVTNLFMLGVLRKALDLALEKVYESSVLDVMLQKAQNARKSLAEARKSMRTKPPPKPERKLTKKSLGLAGTTRVRSESVGSIPGNKKGGLLLFKALLTTLLLLIYFPLLSIFSSYRMDMTFGDGFYFVFATVSTIGLGDIVLPHETNSQVVLQFLLFVPGLALMAQYVAFIAALANSAEQKAEQIIEDHTRATIQSVASTCGTTAHAAAHITADRAKRFGYGLQVSFHSGRFSRLGGSQKMSQASRASRVSIPENDVEAGTSCSAENSFKKENERHTSRQTSRQTSRLTNGHSSKLTIDNLLSQAASLACASKPTNHPPKNQDLVC
jgi:hypothetical protein